MVSSEPRVWAGEGSSVSWKQGMLSAKQGSIDLPGMQEKKPELTSSDHIEQRAALNWMCHGLVANSRHSTDTIKGTRIIHKRRVEVRRKRKL